MEKTRLSLPTLGSGAAVERFDEALQAVLSNIMDPNTPWNRKRQVVLTVTLEPNIDRSMASVGIECTAKLAQPTGYDTQAFLGVEEGRAVAFEHDPHQLQLGLDEKAGRGDPRVVRLDGKGGRA
jgi:hypothetical protein